MLTFAQYTLSKSKQPPFLQSEPSLDFYWPGRQLDPDAIDLRRDSLTHLFALGVGISAINEESAIPILGPGKLNALETCEDKCLSVAKFDQN